MRLLNLFNGILNAVMNNENISELIKYRKIIPYAERNVNKPYFSKLIISGFNLTYVEYEQPFFKGFVSACRKSGRGTSRELTAEEKKINRQKNIARARTNIKNLVNANPSLRKFFTITFSDNVTDLKYANNEFTKYIKRLKRLCKTDFKYVAVVEFQKRGAIHYHLLCNLPFVPQKKLLELWGLGSVDIRKVDKIQNLGSYMVKYMSKDIDDLRLEGEKRYFRSRNLKKPKVLYAQKQIEYVLDNIAPISVFTQDYETEHFGKIKYTYFVVDSYINPLKSGYDYCGYRLGFEKVDCAADDLPFGTAEPLPKMKQLTFFDEDCKYNLF